jgi:valyl-tRNA synthetase
MAMDTRFNPAEIEARWYRDQEASGMFAGDPGSDRAPYVIVIPPPNVTGVLHMGHALNNTIQDVFIRRARMLGRNACWVPGTDHAGIATQNVVEKDLARQKLRKEDLGRDEFNRRVWAWKEKHGGYIIAQLKKLGCSCDWGRERFTLDEGLSRAVIEVFCRLYEKGLVYRAEALVNWCPRCLTTLSNEECPGEEKDGRFWTLRYPVKEMPGRFVEVATTRPETMLGDTAVAVHPDDPRYADLAGRSVVLPLMEREIPVVMDAHADPAKGSGAVKITPAHDFDDFAVAKRHGLPLVCVIGPDGKMSAEAGPYAGLDRFEARERVLADLGARGLLGADEPRRVPLPTCYRCHTITEPRLSVQWFVRMRPLLEPAAEAVKSGRVRIVPDRYAKLYLEWVEKYVDWPISRQLWWGHRIPVFYCRCGETIVTRGEPETCPKCGARDLERDPDVLDTWFSSQLWPFSTQGWPERTPDLAAFYPTHLLVTDRGIIYFWVARMVMAGLEFLGEVPFPTVYIHGTVLDELGRRMSKSLGNGIDPIEMIDLYGCDAVRFTLMLLCTEGQDLKLGKSRFEMGRNFTNKLWNASRFVIMNLGEPGAVPETVPEADLAFEDRWILSRLARTIRETSAALDEYRLNDAATGLYSFVWREFCDWYLEMVKPRLYAEAGDGAAEAGRTAARWTLARVLSVSLRLLSPMTPFVTEEIHDHLVRALGRTPHLIGRSPWPGEDLCREDAAAEAEMGVLTELTRAVRNIRAETGVAEGAKVPLVVSAKDESAASLVLRNADHLRTLAKLSSVEAGVGIAKPQASAAAVVGDLLVYVPLAGVIDVAAERERLTREAAKAEEQLAASERKLGNADFVNRAKPEAVERERVKRDDLAARRTALARQIESLDRL